MKILRVIGSMNPAHGGPCQGIRNSIPALEKLGVHNEVVTLDDPGAAFMGKDPFVIHALGPARGPWQYGPQLHTWLLDNFHRFDIVIVHGLWLYYSQATVKAFRTFQDSTPAPGAGSLRLFVMPHGMLDPYFQRAPDRRLKAVRNLIYWKFIEHKTIEQADGLLFTCQAELLLAREPFRPYLPKAELNVGYGIQAPPPFQQAMTEAFLEKCPTVRDQRYILLLSRIHEKKGVDLLIRAYANIYEPGLPRLVIAGPGMDETFGTQLKEMVALHPPIAEAVHFPGMLSGDAKWGAFYGSEAFVLPSHQENFGIAVVEALACCKPVLISNQVNIWREIEGAGAGFIADDTTNGTEKLLNAWNALSDGEKARMGRQARTAFEKLYAIGPAAERLVETFRK
jgi:glycosyltransferase involved in cell wall biosynthesis